MDEEQEEEFGWWLATALVVGSFIAGLAGALKQMF